MERRKVDLSSERLTLDELGPKGFRVGVFLGIVGLAVAVGAGAAAGDHWRGFYHSWLAHFAYFASLALGGLIFILTQHVTRAGWSVVVRRFAEAVAANLVVLVPLLSIPVLVGMHELFEWTHAEAVAGDELLAKKAPYLYDPFFLGRTLFYLASWAFMAWFFLAHSVKQDRTGDPGLTRTMEKWSAPAILLFALTVTFFAFDFLMSLSPHWYSTIFGVYYFAGAILGFFALLPILVAFAQRSGRIAGIVSTEHFHDMGKLVFAFVVFWAYIGFSQYMLIWYANLPEETIWYLERQTGPWTGVSLFLLFGHFVAPFFFLVSRKTKRRPAVLVVGALWILAMHWLDLQWLVWPAVSPDRLPWGLVDLGLLLGMGGLFFGFVFRRLGRHALVPVGDPRLAESLQFENV